MFEATTENEQGVLLVLGGVLVERGVLDVLHADLAVLDQCR